MNENSILRCFVSGPSAYHDDSPLVMEIAKEKGREFREYIWGVKGISDILKRLNYQKYGDDIVLIYRIPRGSASGVA